MSPTETDGSYQSGIRDTSVRRSARCYRLSNLPRTETRSRGEVRGRKGCLNVDRVAKPIVRGFADDLGDGRVRVDRDGQLVRCAFEQPGKPAFSNHFRRMRTDDMDAEQILRVGIGHHFGETI